MGTVQTVGAQDVQRRLEAVVVGLPGLSARTLKSRRAAVAAEGPANPLSLPGDAGPAIPTTPDGHVDLVGLRASGQHKRAEDYERRLATLTKLEARLDGCRHGKRAGGWGLSAEEANVSLRTLRRWYGAYLKARETGGWHHLLNKKSLSQRGRSRRIPTELARACLDVFAHGNAVGVAVVYERVVLPYFEVRHQKPPSISTLGRLLKNAGLLPPIVRTFAREGPKRFRELHTPHVRRALPAPGSWYCADHRKPDTYGLVADAEGQGWVRYGRRPCPCGSGKERRRCCSVRRLYWTAIIDVGSGAILAVRVSVQPDSAVVAGALRDAFLTFGLPSEALLIDRGAEFNARTITSDLGFAQLGVRIVKAIPFSPESKPIESLFSAFAQRFERLIPAYTGKAAGQRPELTDLQLRDGTLCTADEYVGALGKAVAEWNGFRPIGHRPKPPIEMMPPLTPDRAVSRESLAFLLQGETQLVVRQGKMRLRDREYMSEELAILSGLKLPCRYDPGRLETIYVYGPDGRCLAVPELPPAQYGAWGEANLTAKRAAKAQRRALLSWAVQIKGSAPAAGKDVFGAYAAVAERQAGIASAESGRARQQVAEVELKEAVRKEEEECELTIYDRDPELQRIRELRRSLAEPEGEVSNTHEAVGPELNRELATAVAQGSAGADDAGRGAEDADDDVTDDAAAEVPAAPAEPTAEERAAFEEALRMIREARRLVGQAGVTTKSVRSVAEGLRPEVSAGLRSTLGAKLKRRDRTMLAEVGYVSG